MKEHTDNQGWHIPTLKDLEDIFDFLNEKDLVNEGWIEWNDEIFYIMPNGKIRETTCYPQKGSYRYL